MLSDDHESRSTLEYIPFLAKLQTERAHIKNGQPLTSSFIIQPFKGRIIIWSINLVFHSNQYPFGSNNKLTARTSSALLRPPMSGAFGWTRASARNFLSRDELRFFFENQLLAG